MKKKIIILLIPILIIIGGIFFFKKDISTITNKVNIFKDESPTRVESIDIEIDDSISTEFKAVQIKSFLSQIQTYLTFDREAFSITTNIANADGEIIKSNNYLESGVDYYFLFDIIPNDGYYFADNIPVNINNESFSEDAITRYGTSITILVDAPDVELSVYGIDITPEPNFDNLIEGYNDIEERTFTIKNTGSERLENISVLLSDNNAFDLNTTLLPNSLDGLNEGVVKITPKLGLNPGVYNATITITADGIENPVKKSLELKVLNRVDYLDLTMEDLSQNIVETNTEGFVSNLVFGSISTTNQNPGYSATETNTKLTYLNGNNYSNIKASDFIDIHKNYFYNIVVEADDSHAFSDNIIVRVNNEEISNLSITDNKSKTNYEMNSNKKIQLHLKASISTYGEEGVTIPILRQSKIQYTGNSIYPEILHADSDLVTCTGSNQIYVGDYEISCILNDPDNYSWVGGSNSIKSIKWSIIPIKTTLLPRPSNEVKLPKGNYIDLNTVVEKNTDNPLICTPNGLQTGITNEGCLVKSNFEAVEGRTTTFTINVNGIDVNSDGKDEYTAAEPYPIRVTTISNKPENINWNDKIATWDKINGITSYKVSLYDASNNQEIVSKNTNTNTYDFSNVIEQGKSYYFNVISNTNSGLGETSDSSTILDTREEHILTNELIDHTIVYEDSFSYPISFTDNEGTITYNSSNPSVASINNNGDITINNVGQTEISITASASTNYKETTKSYILTVIPKKIEKPIYNKETTFPYSGKIIYLDFPTNYDEKYMTIDGTYGINPGKYQMIISLKDDTNYTWSDDSIDDIKHNWEIYKIETAMYKISSALNTNSVLDVKGASTANKANIQLYKSSNSTAQRYLIKYVKDGYYSIENTRSLKVLDVQGGKAIKSTNVWQYTYNGSNAQLWKIIKNSDNTYTFISKLGNFALDLKGAKTVNGTNIQIYTNNNSTAQKFNLVKDNNLTGTQTISNGTYVIGISKAKNQVFDIASGSTKNKANVQLYKSNNSKAQQFKITYVKDGYYKIINAKSNKSLDVKGASQLNGANIWQYTYNGSSAQLWKIQKNSDGTYTFISRCNGKAIDAKGGKTTNKTNIQVYTSNGSAAQKYYLTKK